MQLVRVVKRQLNAYVAMPHLSRITFWMHTQNLSNSKDSKNREQYHECPGKARKGQQTLHIDSVLAIYTSATLNSSMPVKQSILNKNQTSYEMVISDEKCTIHGVNDKVYAISLYSSKIDKLQHL